MNASTLYACFLCQLLEVDLEEDFQFVRCQEGNGDSSGLARRGLDLHGVRGFRLVRFWRQATLLFLTKMRRQTTRH